MGGRVIYVTLIVCITLVVLTMLVFQNPIMWRVACAPRTPSHASTPVYAYNSDSTIERWSCE